MAQNAIFRFRAEFSVPIEGQKVKVVPVTCREIPQDCDKLRLLHYVDNRLTDGGEIVSLTRRPTFIPRNLLGTHFS
jgi:hypothetical protein